MVSAEGNWRGGFVLSMRRTFLARLLLEFSSPSPVGASALRLMDDESAIVVVFAFCCCGCSVARTTGQPAGKIFGRIEPFLSFLLLAV